MRKAKIAVLPALLLPCLAALDLKAEDTVSVPLLTLPVHAYSAAFSPDGNQVMVGEGAFTNDYAALWDARTGARIRTFPGHTAHVTSVAFSGDGTKVLTGSMDSSTRLWNAQTGELIKILSYRKARVTSVTLSPDGHKALVMSEDNPTTYLWDMDADTAISIFWQTSTMKGPVTQYRAFSPDGNLAMTGGDSTVRLWDVRSGNMLRYFSYQGRLVWPIAMSGDGKRIVAGMYQGYICVWNTLTGDTVRTFRNRDYLNWTRAAVISPDGKRILAQDDSTAVLWDIDTGKRIRTLIGPRGKGVGFIFPEALAFSPDGDKVLTAAEETGMLCIWSLSDVVPVMPGAKRAASAPTARLLGFDQGRIRFSINADAFKAKKGYVLKIATPLGETLTELDNTSGSGSGSRLEFRVTGMFPRGLYVYRLAEDETVLSSGKIVLE